MTQKILEPIILKADWPTKKEEMKYDWDTRVKDLDIPKGLQIREATSRYTYPDGKKTETFYHKFRFPEFGPAQAYDKMDIVVNFGGINYFLIAMVDYEGDTHPKSASVIFSPTRKPLTQGREWDMEKALQEAIEVTEGTIDLIKKISGWKKDISLVNNVNDAELRLEDIKAGFHNVVPQSDIVLFGQPEFVQTPIFPVYNGRSAGNLLTLNTGWGDSGNINIMMATTTKGKPKKAWFEANCC